MSNSKSFFLVFEGLNGSGKTTLTKLLADRVCHYAEGLEAGHYTEEPHKHSAAHSYIRDVLDKNLIVSPRALELAFAVNRQDHCDRHIMPKLMRPKQLVVCDRYVLSSMVYQDVGAGGYLEVLDLNKRVLEPDLTIFLDVPLDVIPLRLASRKKDPDIFSLDYIKYRKKYFEMIPHARKLGPVEIVPAGGPLEVVYSNVVEVLKSYAAPLSDWLIPILDRSLK